MNTERPEEYSEPPVSKAGQTSSGEQHSENAMYPQATVIVRGETIRDQKLNPSAENSPAKDNEKSSSKELSESKIKMQDRLPALEDDADIGVQKRHVVVRDGKADLAFTGALLAAAAPPSASGGHWEEYRIYETNGGKHVFSKVTRTAFAKEQDHCVAEVFDPSPSSMPSQLLRGARELTRSRPLMWTDAAVTFFGYNPLAKALYRKLGDQFEEHIS
jgi:hypothetical protein